MSNSIKKVLTDMVKSLVFHGVMPFVYHVGAIRPIKNKVVFVEVQGDTLSDNYILVKDSIEDLNTYSICECYLHNEQGILRYYYNSLRFLFAISNCKIVFVNDSCNVFGSFTMRKNSQMVQLWHACGAFKKWGFSVADLAYGDSKKDMLHFPYHKNYSLVTVSSDEVVWAYQEAFGLSEGVVKSLGVSRTDVYFDSEYVDRATSKVRERIQSDKKIILYAPTFRGSRKDAHSPEIADYKLLKQALGRDYVWIEKHHPFVNSKETNRCDDEFVYNLTDMDIDELMCAADICITDYSSVVFEYSLLQRPMVFLANDVESYIDERGFYYGYKDFIPGELVADTNGLIDVIKDIEKDAHKHIDRMIKFRDTYMKNCDGKSTERILQEVIK